MSANNFSGQLILDGGGHSDFKFGFLQELKSLQTCMGTGKSTMIIKSVILDLLHIMLYINVDQVSKPTVY